MITMPVMTARLWMYLTAALLVVGLFVGYTAWIYDKGEDSGLLEGAEDCRLRFEELTKALTKAREQRDKAVQDLKRKSEERLKFRLQDVELVLKQEFKFSHEELYRSEYDYLAACQFPDSVQEKFREGAGRVNAARGRMPGQPATGG